MGMRRLAKKFRQNKKFLLVTVILAAVSGVAAAILSQGLDSIFHRASLAEKTFSRPDQLTEGEKTELKKIIKDKDSAQKQYDSLSDAEKEQAKKAFGSLSEDEKKQYRELGK